MIHNTEKLKIDSRYDSRFDNYGADVGVFRGHGLVYMNSPE